ncbi:hypothetical protein HK096_001731 [Nowakowskiella sp. JEL0078]|nr:hypothetical protein HK096_001731 [Nowakowskiella sp. JEL0078]
MSYVTIEVPTGKEYAILSLNRAPVNSMNYALWLQLGDALTYCESHFTLSTTKQTSAPPNVKTLHDGRSSIRGIIITSALRRHVFTAGNDILELYAPKSNMEQYVQFNTAQNIFLGRLLKTPLLSVAAIRGACPAGGCVLALCCDYRIMTTGTGADVIGLNEVALGIPVPASWIKLMEYLVGGAIVTKMLIGGEMISSKMAKDFGLVNELVDVSDAKSVDDATSRVLNHATKYADSILKMPDEGRVLTKGCLRNDMADTWIQRVPMESLSGWKMLQEPKVVSALGEVLQRLSGDKKSKL